MTEINLGIQTVLYNTPLESLKTSLDMLCNALDYLKTKKNIANIDVFYGDSSPLAIFSDENIQIFQKKYKNYFNFHYHFFNKNLGSAGGQNALAKLNQNDFYIIMNPDICFSYNSIELLFNRILNTPKVGVVEPQQYPCLHIKKINPVTGANQWCSGSCFLIRRSVFEEVDGFDSKNFFLHCDDVDLSWMLKYKGYDLIFEPKATIFHDKKILPTGFISVPYVENYYTFQGNLMFAWKWGNVEYIEKTLAYPLEFRPKYEQEIIKTFLDLKTNNKLVTPIVTKFSDFFEDFDKKGQIQK